MVLANLAKRRLGQLMANSYSSVTQLTSANLMIGGIGLLGLFAMVVGAALGKLPNDLPARMKFVDDAAFVAVLLFGPGCLMAGIGLWKRQRWGRQAALTMGGVAGGFAAAVAVLVGIGVMQANNGFLDYNFLGIFAAYCVATFVILWNDPFAKEES